MIEISTVLVLLVIIAGAILPNVIALARSRSDKDIEANIARLPIEARNEAMQTQVPVRLRISGTSLIMEQVPTTGDATQVKTVDLGSDIQIDSVQLNGANSDEGSWQWMVYPDGSSDRAGIQFSEGTTQRALIMTADGGVRWATGPLPDETQDQWPAGQFVPRSTATSTSTGGTSSAQTPTAGIP